MKKKTDTLRKMTTLTDHLGVLDDCKLLQSPRTGPGGLRI